jgi:hypothetical protein
VFKRVTKNTSLPGIYVRRGRDGSIRTPNCRDACEDDCNYLRFRAADIPITYQENASVILVPQVNVKSRLAHDEHGDRLVGGAKTQENKLL